MKKIIFFLILIILVSLNIFECINVYNSSFVKNINPILGDINTGTLFDPDVEYFNSKYHLYVSKRNDNSIIVYQSKNGKNFKEYNVSLLPNFNSSWDYVVNRATVTKVNDKYYMYYTGQDVVNNVSKIGLAISSDGIKFNRYSDEPILVPSKIYEGTNVMNPKVLYNEKKNKFYMWYNAGEFIEPDVVCYAESDNGITWEKKGVVFKKNPDVSKLDNYKVAMSDIIYYNNAYLMVYIGYSDLSTGRLFLAKSKDGINWNRLNNSLPIVSPSNVGFDASSVYHGTLINNDLKNEWYLYYNGRNDVNEYIGFVKKKNNIID